jgi:transcriptional regulator with XRE-family HTH domain
MPTNQNKPPTVRLRRLAFQLRQLRAQAGLTREVVEEQTGINPGTLYRLEYARSRPQKRTLVALMNLYGATDDVRATLLDIARNADSQGWLRPYQSELTDEYAAYINFEAEASSVRNYESLFIPGLLQTKDYALALGQGAGPTLPQDVVGRGIKARLERQERLTGKPALELWAIFDEAAIRRQVGGPAVMREQLSHLLEAANWPNVTLQLLPYDIGAHPGMSGSFVYMKFADPADPDLVYVDTLTGELFLETDQDLHEYSSMFDHLRASGLSPAKTKSMIITVREGLKER